MTGKSITDVNVLARFVATALDVSGQEKIDDLAVFMLSATENLKKAFGGIEIPPELEPAPVPKNSQNRKKPPKDYVRENILGCIHDAIHNKTPFSKDPLFVEYVGKVFTDRTIDGKHKKDTVISLLKTLYHAQNKPS